MSSVCYELSVLWPERVTTKDGLGYGLYGCETSELWSDHVIRITVLSESHTLRGRTGSALAWHTNRRVFAPRLLQQVLRFVTPIYTVQYVELRGVTATQLDLPSLTLLSVAGCGRLQLWASRRATSVALLQVVDNWPHILWSLILHWETPEHGRLHFPLTTQILQVIEGVLNELTSIQMLFLSRCTSYPYCGNSCRSLCLLYGKVYWWMIVLNWIIYIYEWDPFLSSEW